MALKFVTRQNVRVDWVSSSWLIWTFIDPEAEICFVPTEDVVATAEREDASPSIRRQRHNYDAPYLFFGGDPAKPCLPK